MSWWSKLFSRPVSQPRYGLHPDNPVLCGGSVDGEIDYLKRLRCPAGMQVRFQRLGSLKRTVVEYLKRPDVALVVSRGTRRRMGDDIDVNRLPLDGYLVVCECGQHREEVFIDMYYRGPELPIEAKGWTLTEGVSPAEISAETAECPHCGKELRTPAAKQCRFCKMDWHDPDNVFRRGSMV